MSTPYLAQPDEHQRLRWINGATLEILLDAAATDGQLMLGRFSHTRGDATPLHLHRNEDEMFLLLRGTAIVWCDGVETHLEEGAVVFLPRELPHAYRITSDTADLLVLATPGGLEGMFRAGGLDLATDPADDAQVVPDPAVAERFGNVILGPPPEPA